MLLGSHSHPLLAHSAARLPEIERSEWQRVSQGQAWVEALASQMRGSQKLASLELGPQVLAPQELAPQELVSQKLASRKLASQELAPGSHLG